MVKTVNVTLEVYFTTIFFEIYLFNFRCILYLAFLPMLPLPSLLTPIVFPLHPPWLPAVCDAPLSESTCSHWSTPTYEWEHVVFSFLFLCQFVENDGFHIHPSPYKGHELIFSYGCIVFHGVYVPHFPSPVCHQWAFGLVPGLCDCKQCRYEHTCACVFITERLKILWVYTQ